MKIYRKKKNKFLCKNDKKRKLTQKNRRNRLFYRAGLIITIFRWN